MAWIIPFRPTLPDGLVPRDRWRRGALAFAIGALATFLVNMSFTVWTMTIDAPEGVGVIWEGKQKTVKIWNTTLHVLINIISTVLLAGSNYCMQCLMAPTRKELNNAHDKRKWLDIGIPTIRNFWGISWRRRVLWILLSMSSFPLHLLFNSIVFASIAPSEYYVYVVDAQTLPNTTASSLPESLDTRLLEDIPEFLPKRTLELLTMSECLNAYGNAFQSSRGTLVIVASDIGSVGRAIQSRLHNKRWATGGGEYSSIDWICMNTTDTKTPCDEQIVALKKGSDLWKPFGLEGQACYSDTPEEEHSKLLFSRAICWIVTSLNLVKAVLMLLVAYGGSHTNERPILTVGDAVVSYLEVLDEHTRNMCLKSKKEFAKKDWEPVSQHFRPTRHRKFSAASFTRWAVCISLCLIAMMVCGYLLYFGLSSIRLQNPNATSLDKYGLGVVHSDTIMDNAPLSEHSSSLIFNAILANTPQVLMSLIYFNYNALYTCTSLATEWDRFGSKEKKGLRVSTTTRGVQRQTYFLQLPYRYSLPLAAVSGGLHWLISQSIFLVRIQYYDIEHDVSGETTSCGWSPIGIICVIVAGAVLIGLLVASGFRRLRHGGIPVVGSCSAAIAAACHPDPLEGGSLATKALYWRDVSGKDATTGHCSFTSKDAEKPIEGRLYQ